MFSLFSSPFSSRLFHRPTHRPASRVLAPAATLSAFALLVSAAPAAHAQANLSFTKNGNQQLVLTLASPVTYTVTATATAGTAPLFVFAGVGGATFSSPVSGSLTYSINGGAAQTLSSLANGFGGGGVSTGDFVTYGTVPGVSIGDLVTLSSGTLTTNFPVIGNAPASGSFTTFLISDTNGTLERISTNGVSASAVGAPEPGSLPLLGMGLVTGAGMVGTIRRRKAKKRAA